MTKKYGLPTFPIQSGMSLGEREIDELEWLLEHGVIKSRRHRCRKILKISSIYQLLETADDRYENPYQKIAEATNLQLLLQENGIDVGHWFWYEEEEL